ncbi:MAG TPA: CinA family protein [Pseudonocardiaceae bacterium]
MTGNDAPGGERQRLAELIAEHATTTHVSVAVAESLTGGLVSSALAAATDAGSWYRGCVVAYATQVKHDLLGVPEGPVVSAAAAAAMADGVRRLLDAEVAVAVTGAGGPSGQDGRPPGTVFIGVSHRGGTHAEHRFYPEDDPALVCELAAADTLSLLRDALGRHDAGLGVSGRPG